MYWNVGFMEKKSPAALIDSGESLKNVWIC